MSVRGFCEHHEAGDFEIQAVDRPKSTAQLGLKYASQTWPRILSARSTGNGQPFRRLVDDQPTRILKNNPCFHFRIYDGPLLPPSMARRISKRYLAPFFLTRYRPGDVGD